MTFIFPAVLIVIIIAVVASRMNEGLWSNAIALVNTVFAALIASNFYEPLTIWLTKQVPGGRYSWDITTLWALFAVSMFAMSALTDLVSRYKVRFIKPVEQVGGLLFAAWTGWVVVCFLCMTLHTAPLARNFLWGGFKPEEQMLFGLAPDRQWLGFVQRTSQGALAPVNAGENYAGFDQHAEFMIKYASRREAYAREEGFAGKKPPL